MQALDDRTFRGFADLMYRTAGLCFADNKKSLVASRLGTRIQRLGLDDYRAYMINHEVGHYLGFGHVTCPAAGSASPVMQQQSITLNGCEPNPWPDVTGEKNG